MEKQFSFSFTTKQVNLVLRGLSELPYKDSSIIINLILKQFSDQNKKEPQKAENQEVEPQE